MKMETKKTKTLKKEEFTYNTNIYAEYDTIGGFIRKEIPKKDGK
jgi:hypothetical protein